MSHIHKCTLTQRPTAAMTPVMVKNILNGIVSSEVIPLSASSHPFSILGIDTTDTLQPDPRYYFHTHAVTHADTLYEYSQDIFLCGQCGSWCLQILLSILSWVSICWKHFVSVCLSKHLWRLTLPDDAQKTGNLIVLSKGLSQSYPMTSKWKPKPQAIREGRELNGSEDGWICWWTQMFRRVRF